MATMEANTTPKTETDRLISSDKVEGTNVYNTRGERLGTIESFMVDKLNGRVAYVVMSFGGFLGIGENYHVLPWAKLTYDTRQGGYVIDIDKDTLEGAPVYEPGANPFVDPMYGRRVYDYFDVPFYY
jgi:sporulation protein YlmC with PRC-barrel domain